jgi:hypothetical protein
LQIKINFDYTFKALHQVIDVGFFHIEGYGEDDKVNSGLLYSKMMEDVDDVGCWLPLIHV